MPSKDVAAAAHTGESAIFHFGNYGARAQQKAPPYQIPQIFITSAGNC
jgi:hypothetical protein